MGAQPTLAKPQNMLGLAEVEGSQWAQQSMELSPQDVGPKELRPMGARVFQLGGTGQQTEHV